MAHCLMTARRCISRPAKPFPSATIYRPVKCWPPRAMASAALTAVRWTPSRSVRSQPRWLRLADRPYVVPASPPLPRLVKACRLRLPVGTPRAGETTTMRQTDSVLCWLHFGDLHLKEEGAQNHRDFVALIELANRQLARGVDFAVLPGDE